MSSVPKLDEIGRLVGDPSRTAILNALMDGRAWTGRELAGAAHVSASTASSHLQRLVRGGLLVVVTQGRSHYYRIASSDVATALESLMALAPVSTPRHSSQRRIAADLAAARLCYDHIAGALGVALADALVRRGAVSFSDGSATLTEAGAAFLERAGAKLDAPRTRRPVCRPCLDWSERRPHIAGIAGAALARAALDQDWVRRRRDSRTLTVTVRGTAAFRELFGINGPARDEE